MNRGRSKSINRWQTAIIYIATIGLFATISNDSLTNLDDDYMFGYFVRGGYFAVAAVKSTH